MTKVDEVVAILRDYALDEAQAWRKLVLWYRDNAEAARLDIIITPRQWLWHDMVRVALTFAVTEDRKAATALAEALAGVGTG